jgi:hypothetical protein
MNISKVRGFALGTLLGLMLSASLVWAASLSFNITSAAQDTYIQANILPIANTALCAKYGLGASCTSGQLTTAGCVAVPFTSVTKRIQTYQNCTPFTLDAAGQANHAADMYARDLIALFNNEKSNSINSACTNFKALSAGSQNTICASLGAPVPATICDICN